MLLIKFIKIKKPLDQSPVALKIHPLFPDTVIETLTGP